MSLNRWMGKEDVVCVYNGILLSHKKNEIMPLAAKWMNLEIVILTEGSQKQRKTNIIYHLYVKSRKSGTNEFIYKTEIESQM